MKILTNLGIVAGLHALVLLVIFASPGCSSSKGQSGPPDAPAKADLGPASVAAPDTPSPVVPVGDSPAPAPILYSPTRPGTTAASALEAQPVSGVVPATTYTVVANDSLWLVAKKNHLKVSELAAANSLKPGAPLHLGQKLIIPAKSMGAAVPESAPPKASAAPSPKPAPGESVRHVVRPGETLGVIARKYGVRVGDIATANNISDPAKIHAGQELIIPGGRSPGSAKPASGPSRSAAAPAAAPAPVSPQDLNTGPVPAAPSDVPVIKVDDTAQPAQKNP
jgi:LysM repeat protein